MERTIPDDAAAAVIEVQYRGEREVDSVRAKFEPIKKKQ
jgi:hypothetical protein